MKKIYFSILFVLSFGNLFSQNKMAICELFTSTTCGPCASANPQFDNWLSTYSEKEKVIIIKYHVWWPSPGNDPYYQSNTSQNSGRVSFYSCNAVPTMYVNGTSASYTLSTWKSQIMSAVTLSPLLSMSVTATNLTTSGGDVKITLTAGSSQLPTGTLVLHTVLTESGLQYAGPNGDPKHESVMRKMYPDQNGETIELKAGETKNFVRNVTFASGWKPNNMEIISFLQIKETKEVLQGAKYKITTVGVADEKLIPLSFNLKQNYPNPFNPSTTIEYQIPGKNFVSLKIFDLMGKEIKTLVNNLQDKGSYSIKFESTNLPSGNYIYQLKSGNKVISKSMTLLR